MEQVPRISAALSDEARRGYEVFCEAYGVSLTGLLEAAGQLMNERGELTLESVVDLARRVDLERRRKA